MKKRKVKNGFILGLSIVLLFIGLFTPGLWPYQLPFCLIGGFLLVSAVYDQRTGIQYLV